MIIYYYILLKITIYYYILLFLFFRMKVVADHVRTTPALKTDCDVLPPVHYGPTASSPTAVRSLLGAGLLIGPKVSPVVG